MRLGTRFDRRPASVLVVLAAALWLGATPSRAQARTASDASARALLFRSLARADLEETRRSARALHARASDPDEKRALAELLAALDARASERELRGLALARTTGRLAELRSWHKRHAASQLGRWLAIELALAFDSDGLRARDRARAVEAIERFVEHPATQSGRVAEDLAATLRSTAAQRKALRAATCPERAAQPEPRCAALLARCASWRLALESGAPVPYALVSRSAVDRALRNCARDRARAERRVRTLDKRIRRLRAQIPELTDPERRDARHNRAVIQRDIAKNRAELAATKDKLRALARDDKRLRALRATTVGAPPS